MNEGQAIDIVISVDECGFLLSVGEPDIGIDLAIKLSLARISDKSPIKLSLSKSEHSQLLQVLKKSVASVPKQNTKQLSEKLIKRLNQVSKHTVLS